MFFFLFINKRQQHTKQKKVYTAGRVGPKEPNCNMLLDLSDLSRILSEKVACVKL